MSTIGSIRDRLMTAEEAQLLIAATGYRPRPRLEPWTDLNQFDPPLRVLLLELASPHAIGLTEHGDVAIHTGELALLRGMAGQLAQVSTVAPPVEPQPPPPVIPSHAADVPPAAPAGAPAWEAELDGVQWEVAVAPLHDRVGDGAADPRKAQHRRAIIQTLTEPDRYFLPMVTEDRLEQLDLLVERFPNFHAVIEQIGEDLAFARACMTPLHIDPLLLVGPPGVGKTHFARVLAQTLGFRLTFRSMAEMTAGFVLTGGHPTWMSSTVGLVADAIANGDPVRAPLILLDELDKARIADYSTVAPLLGLLEPESAACFLDEYLQLTMDTRPISWMFTANDVEGINAPLRSRLRVVTIPLPTPQQMPAIVRSVDRELRSEHRGLDHAFAPLSDEVIRRLAAAAPRDVRRMLKAGYARCAKRLAAGGQRVKAMQPQDIS